MKVAVFISSGLGNAILLIPLIKKLKSEGRSVTGFFTSDYGCYELFEDTGILAESIKIGHNKMEWVNLNLHYKNKFEEIYIDNFACTKKIFITAQIIGKKIFAQKLPKGLKPLLNQNTHIIEPIIGLHSASQNMRLFNTKLNDSNLNEELISLGNNNPIPNKTISIQIGSANDINSYKNWSIVYWKSLITQIINFDENYKIILLGDGNEKTLVNNIVEDFGNKIINKVGKTSIKDIKSLLLSSRLFIGLDSGLMHIAASLSIPTFTLWGPSNEVLYGYEKLFPNKHKIVYSNQSCRPCNSWINPNTSRVSNPIDCPDKRCMKELKPEFIFKKLRIFIRSLEK